MAKCYLCMKECEETMDLTPSGGGMIICICIKCHDEHVKGLKAEPKEVK